MGKVRVYELAKELNMSNKELVARLQKMGYPVKSHSSTIEEFLLKEIKERLKVGTVKAVGEVTSRPTVIRRRKKVVPPPTPEPEVQPEGLEAVAQAPVTEEPAVALAEVMETPVPEPIPVIESEAVPFEEQSVLSEMAEAEPEVRAEAVAPVSSLEAIETSPPVEPEVLIPEPLPLAETAAAPVEEERSKKVIPMTEVSEPEAAEVMVEAGAGIEKPEHVEVPLEAAAVAPAAAKTKKRKPKEKGAPGKRPVKADQAPGAKLKKIEKVTTEPARIISRPRPEPQVVSVRPEPSTPKRPVTPKVGAKPEPVFTPSPKPSPLPIEEIKISVAETKKGKKKKGKDIVLPDEEVGRRKGARRREVIERAELYEKTGWDRSSRQRKAARGGKKAKKTEITVPKAIKRRIKVADVISVGDLARKLGVKFQDLIRKLMGLGIMANINQAIDYETASIVAQEFDYEVEKGTFDEEQFLQMNRQDESEIKLRPPVVTVMGHVDHGKTSLLDAIRQTNVIEGEAGGITQHIGAYHVEVEGGRITFLDTPGHEAFTSMRARGAQLTDIVILVVAADDGVMQQTREAADHAKAAGVPIIVAVNKIDKPSAEPDRIRRELADIGLVPEDWGGETLFANLSAKTGQGIQDLLELVLLQAEVLELKAPAQGRAQGRIVEARLDVGRGPVATVLVQKGRLEQGDFFVCGNYYGKIRAMLDDKGQRLNMAGPSIPVEIQGISGVPQAGDEFVVVEGEKRAKQVSQHRQLKQRESELMKSSKLTLENLFDSIKEGGAKELNLILKADVQGSLEAISEALLKLAREAIKINIVHSSIGAISESNIMLASASDALVVGFNVRANPTVQDLAEMEKVQIRYYNVIYKLIDDIKEAMAGLLEPIQEERILGRAEVKTPFHVSKVGTIAGSAVTDGKVVRGALARLLRDDVVIYQGRIDSLKRFKDDAKEVLSGYECGIGLENYNDIKAGDIIEAFILEEVAATLD